MPDDRRDKKYPDYNRLFIEDSFSLDDVRRTPPKNEKGQKPQRQTVEKPQKQAVEKPVKQAAEKPTRQTVEKPIRQSAEKPVKPVKEKPVKQKAEKPQKPLKQALEMPVMFEPAEPVTPAAESQNQAVAELVKPVRAKKSPVIYLLNFAMVVLLCFVAYQVYDIGSYYWGLYTNEKTTEQFREIFEEVKAANSTPRPTHNTAAAPVSSDTPDIEPAAAAEDASHYRSKIELNAKLIAALKEQYKNNEIVGYVYINDTNISYPILQAADNEYYLTHSIDKRTSSTGTIFLDYECDGFTNQNTILYGHNMGNGSMFHNLRYFQTKDFFDTHNTVIIITEAATYEYETFSSYAVSTDLNYIQVSFGSEELFAAFIDKMISLSQVKSSVPVNTSDRILTLSTCQGAGETTTRLVLQARLKSVTTADGITFIPSHE